MSAGWLSQTAGSAVAHYRSQRIIWLGLDSERHIWRALAMSPAGWSAARLYASAAAQFLDPDPNVIIACLMRVG